MAQRILGLDQGRTSVKGVVLLSTMRSFEVADFVEIPIERQDGEEDLSEARKRALGELLEAVGPVEQVISCLPGTVTATKTVSLPFSDAAKIEQTLGFEVEEALPLDLDDLLYDYQFINRDKEGSKLLVGLAPRKQIQEHLDELQEQEIDPRVVMLDGLPLAHIFSEVVSPPEDAGGWAVLDIGAENTSVTTFRCDEEGSPRQAGARTLKRGGEGVTAAVASAFGLSREDAEEKKCLETDLNALDSADPRARRLAEAAASALAPVVIELRRTFRAFSSQFGKSIDHVFITGGGSRLSGLEDYLSSRLGCPTSRLLLHDALPAPDLDLTFNGDLMAKALGLALRGKGYDRYSQVNMRRDEFAFKGDLKYLTQRMGTFAVGAIVLLVLVLLNVSVSFYVQADKRDQIDGSIQKTCKRIIGRSFSNPQRCLGVMLDEIQKVRGGSERALIPTVSSYDIFLKIYQRIERLVKNKKIKVELNTIKIDKRRVRIEGETNSYDSVDKIVRSLRTYKCLSELKEGRVRKSSSGKGKVEFELRARLKC